MKNKWLAKAGLKQVNTWAKDGLTNDGIYQAMGVSQSTFYRYRRNNPEFAQAIDSGRKKIKSATTVNNGNDYWLTKDGLAEVQKMCEKGCTNEQLAAKLSISLSTFYRWQKDKKDFRKAVFSGKVEANSKVVDSLYSLCFARELTEERAIKCKEVYYDDKDRRCEKEYVEVVTLKRVLQPNFSAIAMWINNRIPDEFKRNAGKELLDKERFEHDKKRAEENDW